MLIYSNAYKLKKLLPTAVTFAQASKNKNNYISKKIINLLMVRFVVLASVVAKSVIVVVFLFNKPLFMV